MNLKSFLLVISSTVMFRSGLGMIGIHSKCRGGVYPRSNVPRFPVPEDKVPWNRDYPDYSPPNYTAPGIRGQPWADPEIGHPHFNPKWNELEEKVDRRSYIGKYELNNGFPCNPMGRTGIAGRGLLGRWGPNHAADPVVTRWKRHPNGSLILNDQQPVLQFVAIKRRDTGEWALPGGMVDPGERVSAAAVREFQEEAINSLEMDQDQKDAWMVNFRKFFEMGEVVFKGYIDDPRNTDNAWIESQAYNFHDEDGSVVGQLKLHAGDDAVGVQWVDATPDIVLYASHKDIVLDVTKKRLPPPNNTK